MEKRDITRTDLKHMNLVSKSNTLVCNKGSLMYKFLNPQKVLMKDEQQRVELSEKLHLYHIERPRELLYMNNKFVGFTSPKLEGIILDKYLYDVLPISSYYNLDLLAYIFKDLEEIVKKAHQEGIVMPDLGTITNIIVTKKGLYYIDYSGLQVKDIRTQDISTLLVTNSWNEILYNYKYYQKDLLFTPELDKASLIYMFFYLAFRISLKDYNLKNPKTLEAIFTNIFKINDPVLMYKVWLLYQDEPNEFIADYLSRLAHNYKIVADLKHGRRLLVRK